MSQKIFVPAGEVAPASQVGATIEALSSTIASRRDAGAQSYTYRLLTESPDEVLKKVMEESGEVALAAKDVESWACSSVAATLAYGAGAGASLEEPQLSVELPEEYSQAVDHLRYEAADVVYHLLVVLERYGVSLDEFAAELNNRMTEEERPEGGVRLHERFVRRGK